MKKTVRMYGLKLVMVLVGIVLMFGACAEESSTPIDNSNDGMNFKFAVMSDVHLLAQSLTTPLDPSEVYFEYGRKLLQQSESILEAMTNKIIASDADFVLVPGDLTKDGEKISLEALAGYLQRIEASGKEVYVVPGNHDISNSWAENYSSGNSVSTPNVSTAEFESIMGAYGYAQAINRDPNSMSYVAEPVEGLVILAIDAGRYEENVPGEESVIGGKIKESTLTWANDQIGMAVDEGKTVFALMHFGLVEHFTSQSTFEISSDYVVENWQQIADNFAARGVKVAFTGHFHANDIVKHNNATDWLFDVETGSAISAPSAWRMCEVSNSDILEIKTNHITNIDFDLGGENFVEYSTRVYHEGMYNLIVYTLVQLFGVDATVAGQIAPSISEAWLTHYKGDETTTPQLQGLIDLLMGSGDQTQQYLGTILISMLTDLPPQDNNIKINLTSGDVIP
ncbi:MAG: metallophosphoesterase [Candidatus Kapabacteria bacterium]|jgi:predicted MPP superfamily phosphohydrolase|nr:metallophosphoesterase [Candidatus Kapabacteria bacterium]